MEDITLTKIVILIDLLHGYTMELNSNSRHIIKAATNDALKHLNRLIRQLDNSKNFPCDGIGNVSDKIKEIIDNEIQNATTNQA